MANAFRTPSLTQLYFLVRQADFFGQGHEIFLHGDLLTALRLHLDVLIPDHKDRDFLKIKKLVGKSVQFFLGGSDSFAIGGAVRRRRL